MRRRLFTVLSALSVLLCAATATMWMRSYWRDDYVVVTADRFALYLGNSRCDLSFGWYAFSVNPWLQYGSFISRDYPDNYGPGWHLRHSFYYRPGSLFGPADLGVPHWFIVFLTGGYALAHAFARRTRAEADRRRRAREAGADPASADDRRAMPARFRPTMWLYAPAPIIGIASAVAGTFGPPVMGLETSDLLGRVLLPLAFAYVLLVGGSRALREAAFRLGVRLDRRRQSRAGLCATCGYDLTGNVSGTCPECGTTLQNRTNPTQRDGQNVFRCAKPAIADSR